MIPKVNVYILLQVSELKQSMEKDRAKSLEESSILTSKVQDDKKQLTKYKNQLAKMSEELNTTRSNHLLTSAKMKEQELKMIGQKDVIKEQAEEVEKLRYTTSEIEKCLVEKENEMKQIEGELEMKRQTIETSKDIQRDLTDQVCVEGSQSVLIKSLKSHKISNFQLQDFVLKMSQNSNQSFNTIFSIVVHFNTL